MSTPVFAFGLTPLHMIILLAIGILLFGKRLPEVGRTLAKGIREFQNGMRGVEDEVTGSITRDSEPPPEIRSPKPPARVSETAPKFVEADGTGAPPIA